MNNSLIRADGRRWDQARSVRITSGCQPYAEGSAMIETGNTAVLCAASVEEQVPRWMQGRGTGWVTAEYDMLPRATSTRRSRDRDLGQNRQPIPGDPAPHRPVAAGRHQSGSPGRAGHLPGL